MRCFSTEDLLMVCYLWPKSSFCRRHFKGRLETEELLSIEEGIYPIPIDDILL